MPGHQTLDITDIDHTPVRLAVTPHSDVRRMAMSAYGIIGGAPGPGQSATVRHLVGRLPPTGLRLLIDSQRKAIWEGLTPVVDADRHAYREFDGITRDVDELHAATAWWYGRATPEQWRPIAARPKVFFDSYVRDCAQLGSFLLSRRGGLLPLLEREAERVHAAVTRRALRELLLAVVPRSRVHENRLVGCDTPGRDMMLSTSGLTLVPMFSGVNRGGYIVAPGTDRVGVLSYPVPGLGPLVGPGSRPRPASAADSLAALIGAQRTTLLRDLARPTACGELATRMHLSPGAVTHHVDALVAAGLVTRERQGRSVLVSRTARGEALLGIYGV